MPTPSTFLDLLPEELCYSIVDWLDNPPPSTRDSLQLPSPHLLEDDDQPLKNLSLVSKEFRRFVFPFLFRHIKLRVEDLVKTCSPLSHEDIRTGLDREVGGRRRVYALQQSPWLSLESLPSDYSPDHVLDRANNTIQSIDESCRLIKTSALWHHKSSLTLHTSSDLDFGDRCYITAAMWEGLFEHTQLANIVIIAPPKVLAGLLGSSINTSDSWAFHIPYQRLMLSRYTKGRSLSNAPVPESPSSCKAKTSILNRGWDVFDYDAGSCLNAYGTYHYFEKMPPCILNSSLTSSLLSSSITKVSYRCIFPHYAHISSLVCTLSELRNIEEISVQLAPNPSSNILNNQTFVGRGNLSLRDCWAETERSYIEFIRVLLIGTETQRKPTNLNRFRSHDCCIASIRDDLEAMMTGSSLQWKRVTDGDWVSPHSWEASHSS